MKKMNLFAAFAIMMAMGNMNANAEVGAKRNELHNNKARVERRYDNHNDVHGHKVSRHEHRMMEERRRMEEARRREEMRRMEAHRHYVHHDVVIVDNDVAAGVAVGVAVAAFVSALMR